MLQVTLQGQVQARSAEFADGRVGGWAVYQKGPFFFYHFKIHETLCSYEYNQINNISLSIF